MLLVRNFKEDISSNWALCVGRYSLFSTFEDKHLIYGYEILDNKKKEENKLFENTLHQFHINSNCSQKSALAYEHRFHFILTDAPD